MRGFQPTKFRTTRALDRSSRHNLLYWRGQDYAGIGPGAHARITGDRGKRALSTLRSPEGWLAAVDAQGHGIESDESLSGSECADEYLLMALRLSEGVDLIRHAEIGGRPIAEANIASLQARGLLLRDGKRIAATRAGRLVLDRVILELAA